MTDIERLADLLYEAETEEEYSKVEEALKSIKHDAEMMIDLIGRLRKSKVTA